MAWFRLPNYQTFPKLYDHNLIVTGDPSVSATYDSDGDIVAGLLRAPRSGELKRVHWLVVQVTQWPVNGVRVHVTPVDSVGAGGTPIIGSDHAFADYTGTAPVGPSYFTSPDLTDDGTPTGNYYFLTQDEYFAMQISGIAPFTAGDFFRTAGWSVINYHSFTKWDNLSYQWNGSTWALGPSGNPQGIVLEYTDGVLAPVLVPMMYKGSTASLGLNDEKGNLFTPNLPVRMRGFWTGLTNIPIAGNSCRLYNADDDGLLGEAFIVNENRHAHGNLGNFWKLPGGQTIVLQPGKSYRAVIHEISGTINMGAYNYHLASWREQEWEQDLMKIQYTQRLDHTIPDPWTEDPLRVAQIFPIIDAVDPVKGRSSVSLAGVRNVVSRLVGTRGVVKRLKGLRP